MGAGRLKGQPVTIRKTAHRPSRRRAGVGAYLVAAFTACLLALGVLMAMTTASSFARERRRAAGELAAAALDNARSADQTMPGSLQVLEGVTSQPGITAFDPAQC